MSIYAIGDIHGSLQLLEALLERLAARGAIDQLWFVGDLVNRGPDSAGVVRRIRGLGNKAVIVLGNHDLSLLVHALQPNATARVPTGLQSFLEAEDADELLDWLVKQPLMHHDPALGWTMVHAGLPPSWDIHEALDHAAEMEEALRADHHPQILTQLFGDTPERWSSSLAGAPRLRFITNALTRMRFVTAEGALDMTFKLALADAPTHLVPWFATPGRQSAGSRIVFGHWSALERIAWPEYGVWGIDTGAAWGGQLSALDLTTDPPALIQVEE